MEKYAFNANLYVEGYMRKEATQKEDQYKIWMTDDELEELRRHAKNHRDDIILQLGGFVGLRAFEIPQVQPQHVKRTSDGDHYRLRIPEGKIRLATVESRETPISPVPSSLISIGSSTLKGLIVLSRLSISHRGLSARS